MDDMNRVKILLYVRGLWGCFGRDEQDAFCLPSGGFGAAESNVQPYNPVSNSNVDYFNYPRPRRPISPPTFSNAKFRSNIASATDDRKVREGDLLATMRRPYVERKTQEGTAAIGE